MWLTAPWYACNMRRMTHDLTETLHVRVTSEDLADIKKVIAQTGQDLSEWVRQVLRLAARRRLRAGRGA